ncbi:hypothetical protein [Vitiosangium sp. GDMCC 1.1324]|uniref:hypothetical protein n=1 Tax=Vitiosangium sp. (strain GDMCC 1.1324) TaxID=2138576 RepID=UPI000D38ADE3|nr:hypothetical protein [Vitiosangium sp. GDMCC 1.1324]PTL79407.1 hypothetical protein DAT35_35030 [Vitiosangium sp. GDMCC 1.1324]
MVVDALSRYQALRQQLTRGGSPNGGSLELIGGILRRGERLGREGVEQALRGLSRADIDTWLRTQKPEALQPTLLRAAEEAAEAALGEEGEEAEVWRNSSMEGLTARDRAESASRAIGEWESLHGPLEGDAALKLKSFREGLGRLDAALRSKSRWFIPLNPRRRAERDILDAAERVRAWWFTERAECDDFISALSNRPERPSPHLQSCSDCRADLASTEPVEAPPRRHLSADDLWRFDMGLMSAVELKWVDGHTEKCIDCAQAIWALEEGDEAIEQARDEEQPAAARSSRTAEAAPRRPGAARHPEQREVLEERREFRVVLVRERQRARLLVQPLSGRAVTAAVFLAPGKPSLKPQQGPEGLQFDLGTGGGRSAHLMVRVGNNEIFERDFSF